MPASVIERVRLHSPRCECRFGSPPTARRDVRCASRRSDQSQRGAQQLASIGTGPASSSTSPRSNVGSRDASRNCSSRAARRRLISVASPGRSRYCCQPLSSSTGRETLASLSLREQKHRVVRDAATNVARLESDLDLILPAAALGRYPQLAELYASVRQSVTKRELRGHWVRLGIDSCSDCWGCRVVPLDAAHKRSAPVRRCAAS